MGEPLSFSRDRGLDELGEELRDEHEPAAPAVTAAPAAELEHA
jgi:hypothetical protein